MIHTVIMAGGKGTRFWPLSRSIKAKQFLSIVGEESLLTQTINRVGQISDFQNIWIVGNKNQKIYLDKQASKIPSDQILYEPFGRNTAPCIGWAATEIIKKDPEAIMFVIPSDQYIKDIDNFISTLKQGLKYVEDNNILLTIGIKPTFAHTGYGYIEVSNFNSSITKVTNFCEKPDKSTAQKYLETKRYLWNSGMFIWKSQKILDLIQKNLPEVSKQLSKIAKLDKNIPNYENTFAEIYAQTPSISIDYGIMEKAIDQTYVIQSTFDWDDIGNWSSLEKYWNKDQNNNALHAKTIAIDSYNNIIYSQKRLIALADVSDLIVIDSEDALIIVPKKSDQKIRDVYESLPPEYK